MKIIIDFWPNPYMFFLMNVNLSHSFRYILIRLTIFIHRLHRKIHRVSISYHLRIIVIYKLAKKNLLRDLTIQSNFIPIHFESLQIINQTYLFNSTEVHLSH